MDTVVWRNSWSVCGGNFHVKIAKCHQEKEITVVQHMHSVLNTCTMCKHNLALIYSVSIWGNSEIYTLNNKKCSKNCKSSTICLGDVLVINTCFMCTLYMCCTHYIFYMYMIVYMYIMLVPNVYSLSCCCDRIIVYIVIKDSCI
jgi:hypothetical protein